MNIFRVMLVVACLTISFSGFAKKHIKVKDKRARDERSIDFIPPVEAWLEDSGKDISLQFYRNLGSVKITVTNSSGKTIYETIVDATVTSSWNIILENITKGEYMLSITNDDNVLGGDFFID